MWRTRDTLACNTVWKRARSLRILPSLGPFKPWWYVRVPPVDFHLWRPESSVSRSINQQLCLTVLIDAPRGQASRPHANLASASSPRHTTPPRAMMTRSFSLRMAPLLVTLALMAAVSTAAAAREPRAPGSARALLGNWGRESPPPFPPPSPPTPPPSPPSPPRQTLLQLAQQSVRDRIASWLRGVANRNTAGGTDSSGAGNIFWPRAELTAAAPVGWCRLTVSNPVLKAPMVSALETRIS